MVFDLPQPRTAGKSAEDAIKQLGNYVASMREQLEFVLQNLDSRNIIEISTDITKITNSDGTMAFSSDMLNLLGTDGMGFVAGHDKQGGGFKFEVMGGGGMKLLYMSTEGKLILTRGVVKTIDGGSW